MSNRGILGVPLGARLNYGPSSGGTFASQAEAEAGTDTTKYMNPLRTAEAIAAQAGGGGGGGSAGVVQAVAFDDVAIATRLGVQAHSGASVEDLTDPTSNSGWNTAIAALSEYSRSYAMGAIASASSLWNGALLFNLKAAGAPPVLEVVEGEVHNFNPSTPGTTSFTINGSAGIVAGDALADIEDAVQATGGDFAGVTVDGTSATASGGTTLTTGGTPFASVADGDSPLAFDGDTSTHWFAGFSPGSHVKLGYIMASGAAVNLYKLFNGSTGLYATDWTFEGSADTTDGSDGTWDVLDTQAGQTFAGGGELKSYSIGNTTSYIAYRMNVSAISNGCVVDEFTFFSDGGPANLDINLRFPPSAGSVSLPTVTGSGGTAGYTEAVAAGTLVDGVTVTQL